MQRSVNRLINQMYEQRRLTAELARDNRIAGLHLQWPELAAMDQELATAGADLLLETLDPSRPQTAAGRLASIKAGRLAFLKSHQLDPEYDRIHYQCELCQDSGWIGSQREGRHCGCYQKLLIPLLTEQANMRHLQNVSFASFDESLFSVRADPARYQSELSPRQQINGLRQACERFVRDFDRPDTRNMLFVGAPGTGKTFLMACIAQALLAQGHSVLYLNAPQLFDLLQENRNLLANFNPDSIRLERSSAMQDSIMNCELLLIDDLGTEAGAATRYADLLGVIDGRMLPGLKTIISSNADPATLRDHYDERLLSRLVGGFAVYRFFGEDIRLQLNRRRRT